MKIGDKVHTKYADDFPGQIGEVVGIDGDGYFVPLISVSFNGSALAYGFTREQLEYADA